MTPKEIKHILFERDLTVAGLAKKIGCRREELSMCIRRVRKYPELRKELARALGVSVQELFGTIPRKVA